VSVMPASLSAMLRRRALKWGADLVGFAPVERFDRFPPEHRPSHVMAKARTVIVLALHMVDPLLDLWLHPPRSTGAGRPPTGRAFEDEILRGVCYRLVLLLNRQGVEAEVAPYEPGLYLKDAGVLAGLGVIGRNNLLVTPEYGPRVRLRALVTEAELPASPVMEENPFCEGCDRCIRACPVGALNGGHYDRERCLTSPLHRRRLSPYGEIWCDRCAASCPVGEPAPGDDTLRLLASPSKDGS